MTSRTHLVYGCHDCVEDFAFEGLEDNALVFHLELRQARRWLQYTFELWKLKVCKASDGVN